VGDGGALPIPKSFFLRNPIEVAMRIVDLRSDTLTRPTAAMRAAMAAAEVGDDVYGEDPTVKRLEQIAAALTGKAAALFVASGTMANLVSQLSHCGRGDELILADVPTQKRYNLLKYLCKTLYRGPIGRH